MTVKRGKEMLKEHRQLWHPNDKILTELKQFNIIKGDNNVGKTELLNDISSYLCDIDYLPAKDYYTYEKEGLDFLRRFDSLASKDSDNPTYQRFMNIGCTIEKSKNHLMKIDYIEKNLHHSKYKIMIKGIIELCLKKNIQLFFITYSNHFIESFVQEANTKSDNLVALYEIKKEEVINETHLLLQQRN